MQGSSSNKGLTTLVSAAAGGTASVLGGGKFINGAVTGTFINQYNHSNVNRVDKASFEYGPPSRESVPYGSQIDLESWNNASYGSKLAAYIALCEMAQLGIIPIGPIFSSGEGIIIPGGISGDLSSLCDDSFIAFSLKNIKDGFSVDYSKHVAGSPSLNAAAYTDGSPLYYDVDLNNPNGGLGALVKHSLDAVKQMLGGSLSSASFNEMYMEGRISIWYPPEN